jgi:hypothetical protein
MLNLLQHYQKYYKKCPNQSQPTSSTQLCQQNLPANSKSRTCSNCMLNNPGQFGAPNSSFQTVHNIYNYQSK